MWKVLEHRGCRKGAIKILQALHNHTEMKVRVHDTYLTGVCVRVAQVPLYSSIFIMTLSWRIFELDEQPELGIVNKFSAFNGKPR